MPEDDATQPPNDRRPDDFGSGPEPGAAADDVHADDGDDDGRRRTPFWLETIILLVVALVMALLIKTFLVQAFYIPSGSMEPGLVRNDRILVQKPSYWVGGPERGDVVVFEDPGGWLTGPEPGPTSLLSKGLAKIGLYPTGGHLVKRVIGLPGDVIECCDDQGRLIVNGVPLDEDAFIRPQPDPPAGCDGPMPFGMRGCQLGWQVTVPDDRLFVMGDNRAASADSSDRLCPPRAKRCNEDRAFVPTDLVVGKVFALVWPFDHADLIGRPDVFDDVPDSPPAQEQ